MLSLGPKELQPNKHFKHVGHSDLFYHLNIPKIYKKVAPVFHKKEEIEVWILDKRNISRIVSSVLFAGLIFATLALERLFHKLEHKAKESLPRQAFLYSVKMELIGLGFISFACLVMVDIMQLEGDFFERFEFAHMWMFIFGISRTINSVAGYVTVSRMEKSMFVSESHDLDELIEGEYKLRPMWLTTLCGASTKGVALQYQILKYLFLAKYNLSSFSFNFAMYIRQATSNSIVERLKEPRNLHWFFLTVCAFFYLFVLEWTKELLYQDLLYSVCFSYMNFLFSFSLMLVAQQATYDFIRDNTDNGALPGDYQNTLKVLKEQEDFDSKRGFRKYGLQGGHGEHHEESSSSDDESMMESIRRVGKSLRHSVSHTVHDLSHIDTHHLFDKDAEHPFPYGLTADTLLFMHDLIVMVQSFQFGYFVSINCHQAKHLFAYSVGVVYSIFVIIPHLLIMFWSGPRTVLAINEINATSIPDRHAFHMVQEQIQELNNIRDKIRKAIKELFPKRDIKDVVDAIWIVDNKHRQEQELTGAQIRDLLQKSLKIKVTRRKCKLVVLSMDLDMSGTIDKEEFIEFVDFECSKEIPVLRQKLALAIRNKFPTNDFHTDLKIMWKEASENSDGELDVEKMKKFVADFLEMHLPLGKCDLMISSMDEDNSGTISKKEFYEFLQIDLPENEYRTSEPGSQLNNCVDRMKGAVDITDDIDIPEGKQSVNARDNADVNDTPSKKS